MMKRISNSEEKRGFRSYQGRRLEARPLTTDERASFAIVSFYMILFCLCTFLYWESLVLRIVGVTAASGGLFLFAAAFFNTEAPEKSNSIHPVRSYLLSFFIALLVLFIIRLVGGIIPNFVVAVSVMYGGLVIALLVFRKALVQVVTTMLAVVFVTVTISNWNGVLVGHMKFKDVIRQCGHVVFQIGPIQDIASRLIAGNYMGYLSKIDYLDPQINVLATRMVANAEDDELRKTIAILEFVSKKIHYVSDPDDGMEHAKDPIMTVISGGGDCEDQTLLLSSMLETVGVKTYIAFTDDHVFSVVSFSREYPSLLVSPSLFIEGKPCYSLDPSDPEAEIGWSFVAPEKVRRVFDVQLKRLVRFSLEQTDEPSI